MQYMLPILALSRLCTLNDFGRMTHSCRMLPAVLVAALVLVPVAAAQLIVDRHVQIHDDPNSRAQYDWYTPQRTRDCNAHELFNACGVVFWDSSAPSAIGQPYHASVDHSVDLVGPSGVITWHPAIRCMLYDKVHGRFDAGSHGQGCMMAREHEGHRMEWAIGGSVVGGHEALPGDYRGVVNLDVSHGDESYSRGVHVTYTVHEQRAAACLTAQAGSNLDLGGLPAGFAGIVDVDPETGSVSYPDDSQGETALAAEINFTDTYTTPSGRAGVILTPTKGTSVTVAVKADVKLTHAGSGSELDFTPQIGFRKSNGDWDQSNLTGSYTTITAYVSNGRIQYYIGGELTVPSSTVAGRTYSGTFTIQVSCI